MKVRLCGISDEAGSDIDTQIQAHQELGWRSIELRTVDGQQISDLSEDSFAEVEHKLRLAGIAVEVIASPIGNWERTADNGIVEELTEFSKLLKRAKVLGAHSIRCMSYLQGELDYEKWRRLAVFRLQKLCDLAAREEIYLLHENCSGWGSLSPENSTRLVREVSRSNFGLIFDTGNPVIHDQDSTKWAKLTYKHVRHIHVKDAVVTDSESYTYPGEGNANVGACLEFLISHGFKGAISIEPHLHTVPHKQIKSDAFEKFESYIRYGRKLEEVLANLNDRRAA